jgi:DNA-binding NarL/FixJ family response regulator
VPEPLRIVVADDHPTFRDGMHRLLETQTDLVVVGTAADGQEALATVARLDPDLLLLDLMMPRMTGLVALKQLRGRSIRPRIILVTAAIDRAEIVTALQVGAQGIVLKESASEVLFNSIRTVMAGQYWVGRNRVTDLAGMLRELSAPSPQSSRSKFGLTPRELEVVAMILGGYSNRDIATNFSISEKTVKHHLTNIFDKFGASNRLELALFALHHKVCPTIAAPALSAAGIRRADQLRANPDVGLIPAMSE